ncbi:MAG: DEAD/DEAH box helicase, partial [Paenibacillaceae bacterium]|nr:DEAD/DEAH box helicase [Paenibacillaceae bacterium]
METNKGFAGLGINRPLSDTLQTMGVTVPTPVQREAIPAALKGNDIIAQAQTGTGKTLAFALPIVQRVDPGRNAVQALIITPTRELAIQITAELKKLAPVVGATVLAAYGGQDVEQQLHKLQGAVHIVVGTPGRLLDHLRRESLHFGKLETLVLDEADQMLHMGFLAEVEEIIAQTSSRRQTLLFSATMPGPVRSLARRYMREALIEEIRIEPERVTLDEIEQIVISVSDRGKQAALMEAIRAHNPYLAMIFCRTKRRAATLNEALQTNGFASEELHGDLSQAKREQVMKRFRDAKLQLLVATDMAARGIDVEGVTHVYNYDIPHDAESYIHRIGRTGRAGKTGTAVTFASPRDRYHLDKIEHAIKRELTVQQARRKTASDSGEQQERPAAANKRGTRSGDGRRPAAAATGGFAGRGTRGSAGGRRPAAAADGGFA